MNIILRKDASVKTKKKELSVSIITFCDTHCVDLHASCEASHLRDANSKFFVGIPGLEIIDGHLRSGCTGYGSTVVKAVRDFVKKLSGQQFKINGHFYGPMGFATPFNISKYITE